VKVNPELKEFPWTMEGHIRQVNNAFATRDISTCVCVIVPVGAESGLLQGGGGGGGGGSCIGVTTTPETAAAAAATERPVVSPPIDAFIQDLAQK
jgi:hypothetical protein